MKTTELVEAIEKLKSYSVEDYEELIVVFYLGKHVAAMFRKDSNEMLILNTQDIDFAEICVNYVKTPLKYRL